MPAARPRPCVAAATSGSPWALPSGCACWCWVPMTSCSAWSWRTLAVDSCTTKAPCGGQVAGPSPVDRRKQGMKRSVAVETGGIPLAVLAVRGMVGQIAARGVSAPIQAGRRWVIERTHAWGNQYGKLRWCTERRRLVVAFWLALANAAIVCGRLVRRAWVRYRWDGRPRRRP